MAVIVEDGTGLATANSYLSVADATTYHATYTGSAEWVAATDGEKGLALIQATQFLDNEYHGRWLGYRASEGQALDWPRAGATDDDGYAIDDESLPTALKQATAEFALRVVLGDELHGTTAQSAEIVEESVKVGPIAETIKYSGSKPVSTPSVRGKNLVRGLIEAGGMIYRG